MVQEFKFKNKPNQECLYAWFPGGNEPSRYDSKEIYANVRSRPPRNQTYYDSDLLYQYHESLRPSERDYKPKMSPEEAVKPPWSLHIKPIPNKADNQEDFDQQTEMKASNSRAKSAPSVPTQRIILKIPTPQLNSLFDVENEKRLNSSEQNQNQLDRLEENSNNIDSVIIIKQNGSNEIYETRPKSSFVQRNSNVVLFDKKDSINSLASLNQEGFGNDSSFIYNPLSDSVILNLKNNSSISSDHLRQSNNNLVNEENNAALVAAAATEKCLNGNNSNETKSTEETNISISKKYVKIPYRFKVIDVPNNGKNPIIHYDDLIDYSGNKSRFRQSRSFNKNSRPKTSPVLNMSAAYNESIFYKNLQRSNRPQTAIHKAKITIVGSNVDINSTLNYQNESQSATQVHKNSDHFQETQLEHVEQSKKIKQSQTNQTSNNNEVVLVDGHWKDQLMNREKYLQKRPKYNVRIDPEKVKPDPPAPEIHYNAAETYFYNSMPFRKSTFTINPHFISENLNVTKIDLKNRPLSSSANNVGPVKYRRDYAFVY